MPSFRSEEIERQLWKTAETGMNQSVFAIIDGARRKKIYTTLTASDAQYRCLLPDDTPPVLVEAAPHLVLFRSDSQLLKLVIDQGWGDCWGIFFVSSAGLEVLRRHFSNFIMARVEGQEPLYFRFYDPRVLRIYLPTCNARELEHFFGPVSAFIMEGDEPSTLLRFSRADSELRRDTAVLPISPEAPDRRRM